MILNHFNQELNKLLNQELEIKNQILILKASNNKDQFQRLEKNYHPFLEADQEDLKEIKIKHKNEE